MSTSSSNASSPTTLDAVTPPLFQGLLVEVCENERWYPVAGWGTSLALSDPPRFTPVLLRDSVFGTVERSAAVEDFTRALTAVNAHRMRVAPAGEPPADDAEPSGDSIVAGQHESLYCRVAVPPTELELPQGYEWADYWEVHRGHPRGTDGHGWRYAEDFTAADGSGRGAHFKKTYAATTVVRRRVWRRAVRVADAALVAGVPRYILNEQEESARAYLERRCAEMHYAEKLRHEQRLARARGEPWGAEDDLRQAEALRAYVAAHRAAPQGSNFASTNQSFANPFHPAGDEAADHEKGADAPAADDDSDVLAAAELARAEEAERAVSLSDDSDDYTRRIAEEERHIRGLFGGGEGSMVTFSTGDDALDHTHGVSDGLQAEGSRVNRFVSESPARDGEEAEAEAEGGPQAFASVTNAGSADDFDQLFKKFMPASDEASNTNS